MGVSSSRFVSKVKVKATKVEGPVCLMTSEVLCGTPIFEVAVV